MDDSQAKQKMYDISAQLSELLTRAVQAGIMVGAGKNAAYALHIAAAAAVSVLHPMAQIVANKKGITEANATFETGRKLVNYDTVLFAALIAVHGCHEIGADGHADLETSPAIVLEAMAAFEKLTGRKPDAAIEPTMVAAARGVEAESAAPLESFLQARATNPPPATTQ